MSRPLRIDDPGMWHHVMNRGLERRSVFVCDTDRRRLLRLLADCNRRFQLTTHAYCFMGNHYHLLVEDPWGNLSRAMRHIGGLYTIVARAGDYLWSSHDYRMNEPM
jgi:putative transposase